MRELELYMYYVAHFGNSIKKAFSTASGTITLISGMIIALTGIQKALLALVIVFHCDIITGCIAAWIEHRKKQEKAQVYFFESKKLRLSVVKAVSYMMLILFSWLLGVLFFDQPISLAYSSKAFTPAELTAGACIAIEIWSNIENLKRAGFDLPGKITSLIKTVWNFKTVFITGKEQE